MIFARAGHGAQAEDILARRTVLHRVRAGGVAGEVAAECRIGGRGRIGWPEKPRFARDLLNVGVGRAGFGDEVAVRPVHRLDVLHALERDDERVVLRHRGAGGVAAESARNERPAVLAAGAHDFSDFGFACGKGDGTGLRRGAGCCRRHRRRGRRGRCETLAPEQAFRAGVQVRSEKSFGVKRRVHQIAQAMEQHDVHFLDVRRAFGGHT